jgi:hypothetical protein
MAVKYWCQYCNRIVPKNKKDVGIQVLLLWLVIFLCGFFTCGLAWLMFLAIPVIQIEAATTTVCPICKGKTRAASKQEVASH